MLSALRKWALYALAGLGSLLLLWLLYVWAVPEPTDRLPERIEPEMAGGARLLQTASTHLGAPVLEGNRVELLVNGVEIFPPMLEAIGSARGTIHFLTYVYWRGDIARQFADALSAAARRGVEVRVLLDAFGAEKMREELVRRMEEAGCRIAWFHPLRWYDLRRMNHRTHRKVLVVDGEVAFTGGVGIAEEWTGNARDPDHWRDDHFRLEGPVVRALTGAFAENWLDATGEVLVPEGIGPAAEAGPARIVPVFTSPGGDVSPIAFLYWLALRAARERVDISTPYFVPDPVLTREIAAVARRGVRVRLLVPGERNESWLARYASLTRYAKLLRAGVEIHEFTPTMMHAKTVVVDDAYSVIGSPNFDNRSFELNDEIALLVDDPALNRAIGDSFERDLRRARQVTLESHRSRGPWTRIRSRIALIFREQI